MWKPQRSTSGFSIVVAILMSAFLIVLSMGVLDLILGERRITKVVYNTISGYAGAEGALELALLKIKNHRDGFSDSIALESGASGILASDPAHPKRTDQKIAYEMNTRASSYSGSSVAGEFAIIPLYYDTEQSVTHTDDAAIEKTTGLKVNASTNVVWNIIGNDASGNTLGLVGTGLIGDATLGTQKKVTSDCDEDGNCTIDMTEGMSVHDFLSSVSDPFLVLFSDQPFDYTVSATNGFSLPKTSITASAEIGDFIQNINFSEDKSRLFDALKYSVFTN